MLTADFSSFLSYHCCSWNFHPKRSLLQQNCPFPNYLCSKGISTVILLDTFPCIYCTVKTNLTILVFPHLNFNSDPLIFLNSFMDCVTVETEVSQWVLHWQDVQGPSVPCHNGFSKQSSLIASLKVRNQKCGVKQSCDDLHKLWVDFKVCI